MVALYASATGNDANAGTIGAPVRTFAGMLTRYRAARAGMAAGESATLNFEGDGAEYNFDATTFLGTSDTPPEDGIVRVVGSGTKLPLFTSRLPITGWTAAGTSGIYYATVPGGADIGMLFVGDGVGQRASSGKASPTYLISAFNSMTKVVTVSKSSMGGIAPAVGQVMILPMGWNMSHWRIAAVVDNGSTYTITPADAERYADFAKGNTSEIDGISGIDGLTFAIGPYHIAPQYFWLENDIDFINQPGDWYHDVDLDRIYLKPPAGVANAAALESLGVWRPGPVNTLIEFFSASEPAERWRFESVEFGCTGWVSDENPRAIGYVGYGWGTFGMLDLPEGENPVWSYGFVPPVVGFNRVTDVAFYRCQFRRIEGLALRPWFACKKVSVDECLFEDIGSIAVFGDTSSADPFVEPEANRSADLSIGDNVVRRVGMIYGGYAFYSGAVASPRIRNNRIESVAHGAIVAGNGSRFFPTWAAAPIVEDNDIRSPSRLTVDGGSIYCCLNLTGVRPAAPLGVGYNGPRLVVRRNRVRDARSSGWNPPGGVASAFYFDLGTVGALAQGNDIEDCEVAFKLNCERFNDIVDNRVATDVDKLESITYSGFNVFNEAGVATFYDPPLAPTGSTNLAKWNGTDGFAPFKLVVPFDTIDELFRVPDDPEPFNGDAYESTSARSDNGPFLPAMTRAGPSPRVVALYDLDD